ncbi:MAG: putative DNA binding domain-containing protein [Bacteroidales bacterium]|nr:putative DNA binding domain-containing protein [Bacteroidales bacterium]
MEQNLDQLVKELSKLPKETPGVEFKRNNCDPQMIGRDISALANSATLLDKSHAYMIWGVDDQTHDILGTTVNLSLEKKGNQELENWLHSLLSNNAQFELHHFQIEGKEIDLLVIERAQLFPVSFEKVDYIRVGSYTKPLHDHKSIESRLWVKLHNNKFENEIALQDVNPTVIFNLLRIDLYFDMLHIPQPSDMEATLHYLKEDRIVLLQDNGLYSITNLGVILFAKNLDKFPHLSRKALRMVKYEGLNKYTIEKEFLMNEGYAVGFEQAVQMLSMMLPSKEEVNSPLLKLTELFPIPAIREAVANALIHQDFLVTGAGPVIEIFANRVEITNPGEPLVDIYRIIDNPPKSRNEKLASLMRRLDMCEELGRGWDRMVISCELQQSPAPRIVVYEESTKVVVFAKLEYNNMPLEDKLWSLYLHACVMFVQGNAVSNSTVRKRFGLKESSAAVASRLIKQAVEKGIIKPVDIEASQKHIKYIPAWS